jgi:hypothetical protein
MHVLLDVGLLWTIYVNAEMSLMAQHVAIEDLESDELNHEEVLQLTSDAQRLISEGREATDLERFAAAPVECAIIAVEVYAAGSAKNRDSGRDCRYRNRNGFRRNVFQHRRETTLA